MDSSFKKAAIAVPKLSGFDKSHQNLLTTKVGTITPILVDELIPGTKVNLKMALNAQLPPLASDTFMRCSIKTEAFFVPMRLLAGSFESFFTDDEKVMVGDINSDDGFIYENKKGMLPVMQATSSNGLLSRLNTVGSLADYLGVRSASSDGLEQPISAMPFLAYHRIYSDYYRNSLVQRDCFLPSDPDATYTAKVYAGAAPYTFYTVDNYNLNSVELITLADGHQITELRQRNFGLDYFTTATPTPQQGDAQVVSFDTSGSSGNFSIAALRAANSMQQFKERNNLLGNLYVEQVYGRYGVRPGDGIAQRSIYLGRGEFEVYNKGLFQTSQSIYTVDDEPYNGNISRNPFAGVTGARFGSAYASGSNFVVNFEAKEPGYLFVMATLVPRVTYSTGIKRMLRHYIGAGSISDMANPILQNVGPQPIMRYELTGGSDNSVFGYTDRYAEFKTMEDELHGLLRDGNSLESFALQRSIASSSSPSINTSFLRIPIDYMDKVTATNYNISTYGVWIDSYFDYKVAMPLSKYSLPSLQDPAYEHGKTIVVSKGGSKL